MTALRVPQVDALSLASMLARFTPVGQSIELTADDRRAIRQQLATHLIDSLGLTSETADRFDAIATSPFYAERVTPDELQQRADAIYAGDRAQDINEGRTE